MRSRFYADDVNFKDATGRWQKIENTLTASDRPGYAFGNAANSWDVDLPSRLEANPVRVEENGVWVEFALDGATAAGAAAGSEAVYEDAFEDVDVEYAVTGSSVKETMVLANAGARSSYSFSVDASDGLSARSVGAGIAFVDEGGRTRFSFAAPYMEDAAGKLSDDVRFELRPEADGWQVGLVADRDWIEAPGRRFPVRIDPTTMLHSDMTMNGAGTHAECHMVSSSPNTSYCANGGMYAGMYSSVKYRAMMRWEYFHDQVKRDSLVLDAKLKLFVNWMDGGNSADWAVHKLTSGFTTGATWNKRDGTNSWATAGGDFASNPVATKTIANTTGWYTWRVTDLVQEWADGSSANHGLLLKQVGETTSNRLHISHTDGGDLMPRLEILYTPRGGSQPQYTFHSERLNDRSGYGVNVANGNLMVSSSDVSIPGTGPALNVTRSYNSVPGGWQSFGAWEMNTGADIELQELESGDVVFWGPNAQVAVFRKNADGTYKNPTALNAKLEKDQPSAGQWRITYLQPQSKLIFNSSKKLTKQVDRNGNDINFTYDTSGYLQKITDTQDRDTTFTVAGSGRKMITTITDPASRVHTYSYPDGFLASYTDPDGGVTSYTYEPTSQTDRLKQITDPRGNKTTFTYLSGCLEWQTPCRVSSIKRYTDATNYLETTFSYNSGAGSGDTCKKSTDTNPDASITGHTTITDARGYTTTHCWDKEMRVVFTKDQEGDARKNKWTGNSNVELYTMGSGAEGNAAYDNNRVSSIKSPGGATGTTEGDRASQTFSYAGRASDNFFPSSSQDAEGQTHNFSYTGDSSNLTKVQEQGSATAQIELEYNDNNRNGEVTGDTADDGTVRWSKDGRGNKTTYSYDAKGNLTTIDPPGSAQGNITMTYNTSLSRVATITDGKQQKREFTYDPLDRVTQIKFYNSSNTLVRTDTYSYDDNGNRLTRGDASGSYSYVYDALNRMTQESRQGHTSTLYAYDAMSNLTSITAAGEQTLYTYYPDNIVKEVKEPAESGTTPTTLFTYNKDNARDTTTFPNGVLEDIDYDRAERPTKIKATKSGTTLTEFTYEYTRAGATKERMLKQKQTDVRLNRATRYRYDALSRLDQAVTSGSSSFTWEYEYDNASNRTKKINGASVTSYRYNAANEFCWRVSGTTTATCGDPVPSGAVTYTYDANGDLTGSSGGLAATYNVAKQKTDFKPNTAASNTTFEYAGQGQKERTKKNTQLFMDSVLGVSAEKPGSDYRGYVRDNSGALVGMRNPEGNPVVKKRYYYLRDALGSVVAVTNDQGAVVRRHVYGDPYGEDVSNETVVSGAPSNPWRFAGEYFDSETGLYKIGERYLDPALGRWTQKDPMMQAFSPREVNGYSYVGGDPINKTDPSGTDITATVGGFLGVGGEVSLGIDDEGFPIHGSVGLGAGLGGGASVSTEENGGGLGTGITAGGCLFIRCGSASVGFRSDAPQGITSGSSSGWGLGLGGGVSYSFQF